MLNLIRRYFRNQIKMKEKKSFPKHWGQEPYIQTCDVKELPDGYGQGSSTLCEWIEENILRDRLKSIHTSPNQARVEMNKSLMGSDYKPPTD